VRSFDQPQRYKPFVSRCVLRGGDLEIGSVREVNVKTGLPATTSTERLEQLDDDEHILSVKFVGGDHRLRVRATISCSFSYSTCQMFQFKSDANMAIDISISLRI
jgi:abscisic acid receptor (PYR/PYL family)